MEAKLNIIYEDNHILVANKPNRLLVASDKSGDVTLLSLVRDYNAQNQAEGKKGYLVPIHFLDRPVSGLVLFAKSSKASTRLNKLFQTRNINKTYLAMVEGSPPKDRDQYEDYLQKDHQKNIVKVSNAKNGKHCSLEIKLYKRLSKLCLLEVLPRTGRSHQIRVQLSSRNTPIVGDVKYGSQQTFHNAIALHAWKLQFEHPVKKEIMNFEAPLPNIWTSTWNSLEDI